MVKRKVKKMAYIKLKNISKKYKNSDKMVLENINIQSQNEEFLVLVGPSGCGKSTILRMIAGLTEITDGEIFIDDVLVNNLEPKDRDIAMVFQNYALYPHLTVFQNIAYPLKQRKVSKEQQKKQVEETAAMLNLTHLLDRKPKHLSGGERQRTALARAMVRSPKLFLMDEPLSNLDAQLRTQTRGEILRLHKSLKTTFIYVTHDQTEAMTMGDRIAVMNNGEIQQIASPYDIYNNPANLFVAKFIGSPAINLISGRIEFNKGSGSILVKFENNEYCFKLSDEKVEALKNEGVSNNKKVIVGIRPENMCLSKQKENNILLKIVQKELMGAELFLYGEVGSSTIVFKVPANKEFSNMSEAKVEFNIENVHVFDEETGQNILNKENPCDILTW